MFTVSEITSAQPAHLIFYAAVKLVNPSIICNHLLLEKIPADIQRAAEYTMDRSPDHQMADI